MTDHTDCPFCSVKEKILLENTTAHAFLSNPRKVPGHILVTPKRHIEQPWNLKPEELQDIFALIYEIEQKLIGSLGDGVDIRQNYRPFMEQGTLKVNHIHFHVIPRSLYDYIYKVSEKYDTELFAELDDLERKEVAKLFK